MMIDAKGNFFFQNRPATFSPLQTFVDVLDLVKNAGFRQVSLQTETKR
jgi:hypothetical protein